MKKIVNFLMILVLFILHNPSFACELRSDLVFAKQSVPTTILYNGCRQSVYSEMVYAQSGDKGIAKKDFKFDMVNVKIQKAYLVDHVGWKTVAEAELDENGVAQFIMDTFIFIQGGTIKDLSVTADISLEDPDNPNNYFLRVIPLRDPAQADQPPQTRDCLIKQKVHLVWTDFHKDPQNPMLACEWYNGGNLKDFGGEGEQTFGNPSLPVELSSFTGKAVPGGVKLEWVTQSETNNLGFAVERSAETGIWEKITEKLIPGYGTSVEIHHYSYLDNRSGLNGEIKYRLKQIDTSGSFEYLPETTINIEKPANFQLAQNYPNPFNPITTISYSIPSQTNVKLTVYNNLGQKVATLVDEMKNAGNYSLKFDASQLPSGIYFYHLQAGEYYEIKKMILQK